MFSHIFLGSNDLDRSQTFYDALFAAIGGKPGHRDEAKNRIVYAHDGGRLMLAIPIDGKPATFGNGATTGFAMTSPEQVHAWHDAGVAAGGTTCEDPPGLREAAGLYLAYLRDPDGNKLCALHRMPK